MNRTGMVSKWMMGCAGLALALNLLASARADDWTQMSQDVAHQSAIHRFYTAFAAHDAEAMLREYHPEIEFSDPIFDTLKGAEARAMWRFLIERGPELKIKHDSVIVRQGQGQAFWQAWYPFSLTGNQVHNQIQARFEFKDGKIWRHRDSFDLSVWTCQALAPAGCLFTNHPQIQSRLKATIRHTLDEWIKAHPEKQ